MSRRAWERRAIARGSEAQLLPLATIPREAETILPAGPNRLLAATQLARVELAPADARGYRAGIQQGQRLMRWFLQARFTIAVKPVDRRLLLTDGDRTYKPRVAGSRSAIRGRAVSRGGAPGRSAGEALSILVGVAMRHLYGHSIRAPAPSARESPSDIPPTSWPDAAAPECRAPSSRSPR